MAEVCRYCGKGRHEAEACPRVVAIEYGIADDKRYIKRIEFIRPIADDSVFGRIFGPGIFTK